MTKWEFKRKDTAPVHSEAPPHSPGVTWRSLLLALILIPPNCWWVIEVEIVAYSGHPTCLSLFSHAVFSLFMVILANLLLRRWWPHWALTQGELVVVYTLVCLASSMCGHDMLQLLVPALPHVARFASPENRWATLIQRHQAPWLTVRDPTALKGYYEGHANLYTVEALRPWLTPLLFWTAFLFALLLAKLCINVLMRKQWTENEKLTYPIIQLPLILTERGGASGLFRHRLLWGGFAAGSLLDLWNGFATLYPFLPLLNVKLHDLSPYFPNPPWNAMGWTPLSFYPFVVAISFFLPTEVSFSCWFFFLFRKVQQVVTAAFGWNQGAPGFPYLIEQSWGAWMGFVGMAAWSSRDYLRGVLRRALGQPGGLEDREEPIPYRLALFGLTGTLAYLVIFWQSAGATVPIALLYFLLYLALSTAIAKMRAEIGPPTHEMGGMATTRMLVNAFGTEALGPGNLTMFSMLWFTNRMYRGVPMPHQLEGFKLAERTHVNGRRLFFAMMGATTLGTLMAFWSILHTAYHNQGASPSEMGFSWETYNQLAQWLTVPQPPHQAAMNAIAVGLGFTWLLAALRRRFLGFPFHPAGYALGITFGLDYVWFPVLLAWTLKTLSLRYGGLKTYRQALPLCLGVILGEFVFGNFWSALSVITGRRMYTFWIF